MEPKFEFTRTELIEVFKKWQKDDSKETTPVDSKDWPADSADYIIDTLKQK